MAVETKNIRHFEDITERLDEIISTVRSKDTSLERSLDLFDEAIELGSKAVELVDTMEFSPAEEARLNGEQAADENAEAAGAPDTGAPDAPAAQDQAAENNA